MSETVLETPVVLSGEALTVTPPTTPVKDLADASADFIAKYREQEVKPEGIVPAPDAPVVPVEEPGEVKVAETEVKPEGEPKSQFRNPDGTFAKTIKAKWGDTEIEVPEGLLLPLKRGETVEYEALSETQKRGMLYNDYNKSKQELAEERRMGRAEVATAKAEAETWKAITKEILENPAKAMKYRQDPELANLWADAAEGRLVQARQEAIAQASQQYESQDAVARIQGWAEAMAPEFPGVDSQTVLREYGEYLYQHGEAVKAGRMMEDPGAISMERLRTYFTNHHQRVAQVTSPLQAQIEELKAQIASLTAQKAAETTKATVQHAANRANTPPAIAGTGGVAMGNTGAITAPGGKPMSLNDASKEFLKRYQ